ncbi:MAG: ATP-dependent Clp protease ATP-binding subunit, partial [Oscillospiraceae bacterium]
MKKTLCSKCKKNPAVIFISRIEGDKTIPEGLCIKCAMDMNLGPVKQMMDSMGVTEDDVDAISEQFNSLMGYGEDDEEDFEAGGTPTMPSLQGLFNALEMEDQNFGDNDFLTAEEPTEEKEKSVKSNTKKDKKKNKGKNKRKYLNLYCTDLTGKAREGKIDIIIGREKEIYRVTQILCRRSKNNPCLIGEPGVGKTAIAEGLALKIANNDVPAKL